MRQLIYTSSFEKTLIGSSGSELLDSFYYPAQTTDNLQSEPVIDVEAILRMLYEEATEQCDSADRDLVDPLVEFGVELNLTPKDIAIQRLNRTLKLDRVQLARNNSLQMVCEASGDRS